MGKWINEHLIPKILAFVNTKAVQSIKDGMVYTMPLLIVGSIFLILANLPVKQAADALAAAGITTILSQAVVQPLTSAPSSRLLAFPILMLSWKSKSR